jgi:hypothetical protein
MEMAGALGAGVDGTAAAIAAVVMAAEAATEEGINTV